ncbi:hypothetical protein TSUD_422630, partial [Trifolium subterraneum]
LYPRLFAISSHPHATINELGVWVNGVWRWHLEWRRSFFVWEEELYGQFMRVVESIILSHEEDVWEFAFDRGGGYTVKVSYLSLCDKLSPPSISSLRAVTCRVVDCVWDSWAPSKVLVFSWQVLLGRLPTRVNLGRRGVLPSSEQRCCHCDVGCLETEDHLFLLCPFAWNIWMEIYKWFGLVEVLPDTIGGLFPAFFKALKVPKKKHKGVVMLWQAVVWVIWKTRNDTIFAQKPRNVHEVVDKIKHMSWQWLLAKKSKSPCLFYEWCIDPLYCIIS